MAMSGHSSDEADGTYVVPPAPRVTLPVRYEEGRFPVRRVFCVGRNYADHAVEMGHDPDREPPFFFEKAPSNLVEGTWIPYPSASQDVHHEIELVVALGRGGTDLPPATALTTIYGYAVGIDLTRRDLQAEAKKLGRPWTSAKAFDHSAPCGPIVPASRIGHPESGRIWLDIDGERRQEGDLAQLIWKVPEIIAQLSGLFALAPGDLIFTGTPAGVGPIYRQNRLTGGVAGIGEIDVSIT